MLDKTAESLNRFVNWDSSHRFGLGRMAVVLCVGEKEERERGGEREGETYADELFDLTLLHALLESALFGGC